MRKEKYMKKMFVYSIKAQTLKFFSVVCLSVIALLVLIAFIPTYEPTVINTLYTETANVKFNKIKDALNKMLDYIIENFKDMNLKFINLIQIH